jgi:hypothetical protein
MRLDFGIRQVNYDFMNTPAVGCWIEMPHFARESGQGLLKIPGAILIGIKKLCPIKVIHEWPPHGSGQMVERLTKKADMCWPVKGASQIFFQQCVGSRTDSFPTVDQSDIRGLVTA